MAKNICLLAFNEFIEFEPIQNKSNLNIIEIESDENALRSVELGILVKM